MNAVRKKKSKNAEREGFEPSVPRKGHTRFPGEPVRPLWHLSVLYKMIARRRATKIEVFRSYINELKANIKTILNVGFNAFSIVSCRGKSPPGCRFQSGLKNPISYLIHYFI